MNIRLNNRVIKLHMRWVILMFLFVSRLSSLHICLLFNDLSAPSTTLFNTASPTPLTGVVPDGCRSMPWNGSDVVWITSGAACLSHSDMTINSIGRMSHKQCRQCVTSACTYMCEPGMRTGSVQWPQDAADRHRTLFLVIFWAPVRSRQQLTMI